MRLPMLGTCHAIPNLYGSREKNATRSKFAGRWGHRGSTTERRFGMVFSIPELPYGDGCKVRGQGQRDWPAVGTLIRCEPQTAYAAMGSAGLSP